MDPTPEQQQAVDLFNADAESLAVEAGAGTGKTTTLQAMANSTDRIGYYLAFNKAIVNEAQRKMPETVISSTAHSLAFRAVGHKYKHRLNSGRMRSWDIARRLDVHPITLRVGQARKTLSADFLAGLVMRGVRSFCQSDANRPDLWHVPYVEGIDPLDNGSRTFVNNNEVRERLLPSLHRAWDDQLNPDGSLPFTHDSYLKVWQLGDPRIPGEFILFDEAQDAAPVMLAAVAAQDLAQLVYVGDSQQQIYEWRGAVNALASVGAEHRTFLTQSFRFGPAIADVANLVLTELEADLRLVGLPSIDSTIESLTTPDCVLTRTNATSVSKVLAYQRDNRKVHLVGGGTEVVSFARAAGQLMAGERTWHPELACFDTWGEVQEYVEQDAQGGDLRLLVGLVDEYGVDVILEALDNMIPEHLAEVIVSTAHKSKGREWDTVKLAGDFPSENLEPGEWRLVYVAATRARHVLDVGECMAIDDLISDRESALVDEVES